MEKYSHPLMKLSKINNSEECSYQLNLWSMNQKQK